MPVPGRRVTPALVGALKGWETGRGPDGRLLPHGSPALVAYLCPAGKWTIAWGLTGPDIVRGTTWTAWQCSVRFAARLAEVQAKVDRLIGSAATTQGQFDALVAFAWNVGVDALAGSHLLAHHRAGFYAAAAADFGTWVHAHVDGKLVVEPGLVTRRAAEAAIYRGGPPCP